MSVDMSPKAVRQRLALVSEGASLRPQDRLKAKLDMSAEGVRRRLERVVELNRLCAALRASAAR